MKHLSWLCMLFMVPKAPGKLNNSPANQFLPKCKLLSFRLNAEATPMGILTYNLGDCVYNGKQLEKILYDDKSPKVVPHNYDFNYDGNNNLIAIKSYNKAGSQVAHLQYPDGTKNSLAAAVAVTYSYNADVEIVDSFTMHFNNRFQLTSITKNKQVLRIDKYNLQGNCIKTTLYNGRSATKVYTYTSYDNKRNPATTNRSLQIYLGDYSANNITQRIRSVYSSGKAITDTLVMGYMYNANSYPTQANGQTYATYSCSKIFPKL